MNRKRIIVLLALLMLVVAVLASTALAGGKDCGKKWGAPSAPAIPTLQ
jgi:hypothetical protein